ncbi:VanZ family protein [Microbacterium testaceum]|uniref:VanZ family protein n=1 Tax=Microbacterium testaceum TaxID=2033 RepID=UPI002AC3FB27|nr:VanZ family protein [Microbacterium testaceum]MDZ5145820.1 VanZ family protein [Microbacterium testaceum]
MPDPRSPSRRRRVATAVAAAYLAALGIIVLWPDHLDRNTGAAYAVLYDLLPAVTPRTMDFGLNIVLFIPFGIVLGALLHGHPWRVVGIAWLVPLLVEIVQGLFLPGRTSSAADVVANAVGGLVGAFAMTATRRILLHRRTRRRR